MSTVRIDSDRTITIMDVRSYHQGDDWYMFESLIFKDLFIEVWENDVYFCKLIGNSFCRLAKLPDLTELNKTLDLTNINGRVLFHQHCSARFSEVISAIII